MKAESSAALKKALKGKVYAKGDDIVEGDDIFYKQRKNMKGNDVWEGPSKVVATNGRKLFVDKGARLGTVNRDDSVRCGEEFWRMSDKEMSDQEIEDRLAKVLKKVKSSEGEEVAIDSDSESESESEDEDIEDSEEIESEETESQEIESEEDENLQETEGILEDNDEDEEETSRHERTSRF